MSIYSDGAVSIMDIEKMDPMVRKMGVHQEAFQKALEEGDAVNARLHLVEIKKFAEYLDDDLTISIKKSENLEDLSGVSHFAGGVPLAKFNETGSNFDVAQRDSVLPGFIPAARSHGQIKKHAGTFGRRV
jgi:hypothetical protein